MKNRSTNISTHGTVAKEYDAMSNSNSYVFTVRPTSEISYESDVLWFQERTNILNVEIGSNIKPISTANWFIYSSSMKKGDFTNLDTSSVTDMSSMFLNTGYSATTFELKGLENWDVSSVTDMSSMFYNAGFNVTSFNLNLSNWNTLSVTDMSNMFFRAGYSATSWSVTIPKTTGSLTNTTSRWYGSSSSTYTSPDTGKSFTLAS